MWLTEGVMSGHKWTCFILGKRFCPNVWANRLYTVNALSTETHLVASWYINPLNPRIKI